MHLGLLRSAARLLAGAALLASSAVGHAGDFSFSGFATLAAGKVTSGTRDTPLQGYFDCPCFIADYGHGALYGPGWTAWPESKVGLQGTYNFSQDLSATVQVVGRGVDSVKGYLEWAYLSYDLTPNWTVQVGRKRLPLFYYSDFQDIGYAYTWLRPPPDVYGWEIVNYNGFNATYRNEWGGWAVKSNLFAGREDTTDNLYSRIYSSTPQDVTWKAIRGADLTLTRDWFTTRFTYIRSQVQQWDKTGGVRTPVTPDPSRDVAAEQQTIYGVAANADYGNWLVRWEYSVFDRSTYSLLGKSYMLGIGHRFGKFTPMYTYSKYHETNEFDPTGTQSDHGSAFTLRYELTNSSALKVQWDMFWDHSGPNLDFPGRTNAISLSYDVVF